MSFFNAALRRNRNQARTFLYKWSFFPYLSAIVSPDDGIENINHDTNKNMFKRYISYVKAYSSVNIYIAILFFMQMSYNSYYHLSIKKQQKKHVLRLEDKGVTLKRI